MALKTLICPRCGANLSVEEGKDAYFCSYCGTKFEPEVQKVEVSGKVTFEKEIKRTRYTRTEQYNTGAIVLTMIGVALFIYGVVTMFKSIAGGLIMCLISIPFIIAVVAIKYYTLKGKCPYCGNEVTITQRKNVTAKCIHCENMINIKEDCLETIG